MKKQTNTQRVVIEGVEPEIDGGRFSIRRVIRDRITVEADFIADGHDEVRGMLLYRGPGDRQWKKTPMAPLVNDRWRGEFQVTKAGLYRYTLTAWIDRYATYRRDLGKRILAEQDVSSELLVGTEMIDTVRKRSRGEDRKLLISWMKSLEAEPPLDITQRVATILHEQLATVMARYPESGAVTQYELTLEALVERERAGFSAWYEMFPRSWGAKPGIHAAFSEAEKHLPYIESMGFDVVYLPPIHPIGKTFRKGKNNHLVAEKNDPGSPWAIGSSDGGHKAVNPKLGSLDDFKRFVEKARDLGMEVALDLALQCSPDHPYVKEHPEWFRKRPDGTIQYAENPPKKYQDIYPFDFESPHARDLWEEIKSVVLHWIDQGIRIFRVDNPHTKPLEFWQWLIAEIKKTNPETIFLAEAFTRPKVMYRLAKIGFTQSYTYFTWRNAKWDLTQYMNELTQTKVREYFRPNFWTNTPDILNEYLQTGGRAAFMARLVLAATMTASYGIYGPAFELIERTPREPGSEEYIDSEKYEIKARDLNRPDSLAPFIARVNRIRLENAALQSNWRFQFHHVDNEQLICYSKRSDDGGNVIIVVVNLDPFRQHSGWVHLSLESLGIDPSSQFQVHDLLSDARYLWRGPSNYVELNPHSCPAHIFRVRRRVLSEHDFDYYA